MQNDGQQIGQLDNRKFQLPVKKPILKNASVVASSNLPSSDAEFWKEKIPELENKK